MIADVVMVAHGPAGMATRSARPSPAALTLGPVHAEWVLRRGPGPVLEPPTHLVAVAEGHTEAAVVLFTVDRAAWSRLDEQWLPVRWAVSVSVSEPLKLPADGTAWDRAREVVRHLARSAVDGTVPIAVAGPAERAVWRAAITGVCAAVAAPNRPAAAATGG